jgi:predicted transcriptional regulator
MFKEYVDDLIKKGFLAVKTDEEMKKTISITKKGNDFLEQYKVIENFVDSFGL